MSYAPIAGGMTPSVTPSGTPLVTVLTPVYNGEPYLADCIESVLAQTYERWEYIIVDNASTDRTGDIIRRYADRDPRIRAYTNERLVPVIDNHNIALAHVSPASAWCKFVSADDLLMPECLERMVRLGTEHPSVGLIAAYQVQGTRVALGGLPYPSPVTPGRRIGRDSLLGVLSVFGNPTAHMLRADLVRRRQPFYDASILHADEAACYDVLQDTDFGFVHQVLTFERIHPGSVTVSAARRLNTFLFAHMKMLKTYGPVYLTAEEYERALSERMATYYGFLARALLSPARREIWDYHIQRLAELGVVVRRSGVARAILRQVAHAFGGPVRELRNAVRVLRSRGSDEVAWREWWAPTGFEPIRSVRPSEPREARFATRW